MGVRLRHGGRHAQRIDAHRFFAEHDRKHLRRKNRDEAREDNRDDEKNIPQAVEFGILDKSALPPVPPAEIKLTDEQKAHNALIAEKVADMKAKGQL